MRRLCLFLALAACTATPLAEPEARVTDVILYRDTVNVLMSDGSLCVVDRPGRATTYRSMTVGCTHSLSVSVSGAPIGPRQVLRAGGDLVFVDGTGWG